MSTIVETPKGEQVVFRLLPAAHRSIREVAAFTGRTRSQVLREAVDHYLAEMTKSKP